MITDKDMQAIKAFMEKKGILNGEISSEAEGKIRKYDLTPKAFYVKGGKFTLQEYCILMVDANNNGHLFKIEKLGQNDFVDMVRTIALLGFKTFESCLEVSCTFAKKGWNLYAEDYNPFHKS